MEFAKHLSGEEHSRQKVWSRDLQRRLKELEKKEQETEAWEGSDTRGREGMDLLGVNHSRGTALSGGGTQPDCDFK